MPAYVIGQLEIFDPEGYKAYLAGFMPIFERHGGELLASSSAETEVVEGNWDYPRTVLMRFPDLAAAKAWLADPDYRTLAQHRYATARANLAIVEGIA